MTTRDLPTTFANTGCSLHEQELLVGIADKIMPHFDQAFKPHFPYQNSWEKFVQRYNKKFLIVLPLGAGFDWKRVDSALTEYFKDRRVRWNWINDNQSIQLSSF